MVRKTLLVALAIGLTVSAAQAQSAKFEISATAGWTFSDGVSGASVTVPGEGTFNRVDPKDAFSWGLRGGYLLTENHEIGFLFNLQATELEVSGSETVSLGDQNVYNYHGYYAYSFGDIDRQLRPYLLVGLGATQFGAVEVPDREDISGGTRFSGTFGLGIKVFPFASPKFGFRAEARYTPTYIKSDPGGWWCGYWGCYATENPQYANQFELNGGFILRF
ncbi:MAG: porin family protein [Gemmatimonadetes bacterium]|nr:porin family protein [Gemmatimonadota bacterium]